MELTITTPATDEDIKSYINQRWQQVGSDLMMVCQDASNEELGYGPEEDVDCGDCYGDAVEGFKDFIMDEFHDKLGEDFEAMRDRIQLFVNKFEG